MKKLLLCLAVAMLGCGDVSETSTTEQKANGPVRSETRYDGYAIRTVEHDGHLFVVVSGNAIQHHPDCPCRSKESADGEVLHNHAR